ncbi:hypothetical protein CkaCkLH20_09826 [Colletotrichum karsti]|uniref:Zn(2)-C6 fungal-type domain-containing protein n=1 Tax=Colletotrichum karsti TaxID=1095194 RepID=A0A9P6HYU9_9PEZI|nr:uncharacterized protein CkaCkLH20_09826 [Colletotrichum karsti]KAF9872647.1 hypothetical protein CkaCkLH20_09826 [Colletotrichum karsti]
MPDQSFRRLLPAPKSGLPPVSRVLPPTSKKRSEALTKVACERCRFKKKRCDGKRPKCTSCVDLDVDCKYESIDEKETPVMALKRGNQDLKRENEELKSENEQIKRDLEALRALFPRSFFAQHDSLSPEAKALAFKEFRFATDPNVALRSVIPSGPAPQQFVPQLRTNYEFQLHRDYPVAYPLLGQGQRFASPESTDSRPSKRSRITDVSDSESSSPEPSSIFSHGSVAGSSSGDATNESMLLRSSISSVFPAEPVQSPIQTDPRLLNLDIEYWTVVSIPSDHAAKAITLYLETDHAMLGLFDTELFIHDLTHYQHRFCSPLLVCALLAFACQAYATYHPSASGWSHELEAEAGRLWRADREDSLTTVAALAFLIQSVGCNGNGALDVEYINETAAMARRLKLFGTSDASTSEDLKDLSEEDARGKAKVAWGVFCTLSMVAQFFLPATTEYPPNLPIPGKDVKGLQNESAPRSHGNDAPSGTSSRRKRVAASPFSETFAAFCELWVISSRLTWYYQHEGPGRASRAFAIEKYYKLLTWAANLPESLVRSKHSPSYVLNLHMWFHGTVLYLFRPFIPIDKQHGFKSWTPSAAQVPAIFAASLEQLKDLVDVYMSLPSRTNSILWHTALMHVANAAAIVSSDPEWRHHFLKCIFAYLGLYRSFTVAGVIAKGLVAMAVKRGALDNTEGRYLLQELKATKNQRALETATGFFVTDFDLAVIDPKAATANTLIREFDDLSLLDEFTVGVV